MASITVKNISTGALYVRDLSDTIEVNESVTFTRSFGELTAMTALNAFIADGSLQLVSVVTTDQEAFWANAGQRLTTSAAMTFFVSPTGNDTNTGLSITAPLLTIQAAINKVPLNIKHVVTLNIAAGTYVENLVFPPFQFAGAGALLVQGTSWTNSTLATGTATGTSTAYTAVVAATATLGTFTDSAQTWTASDLKGRFLTITSGPASGQQRVIIGNTGTALTLNSVITSLVAGTTYSIQEPSVIITGTVIIGGLGGYTSNTTPLQLSDLTMTSTAVTVTVVNSRVRASFQSAQTVSLRRTRIITSATGTPAFVCAFAWCGTVGTAFFRNTNAAGAQSAGYVTGSDSQLVDTSGFWTSVPSSVQGGTLKVYSGGAVTFGNVSNTPVVEITGAAGYALGFGDDSSDNVSSSGKVFSLLVVGSGGSSGTIIRNGSSLFVTGSGPAFKSTGSNGVELQSGSKLVVAAITTLTVTGTTNDYVIDSENLSAATFNALSPKTKVGTAVSLLRVLP